MDLEATAERLQHRVHKRVLEDPRGAGRIVAAAVRQVRPKAIREGSRSFDRRRRAASVAAHDARVLERRLKLLRERGIEVEQVDGRWLRRNTKGRLVPVETESQLVARRVARGEREALKSARRYAKRLGVRQPPARGRPNWAELDPRLYDFYARRVALEASRIAHDVVIDAFRDAALDRAEALNVGWVRQCQRNACGACLALADGEVHEPWDRRFYRHTRCRCIPVPVGRRRRRPLTGQQIFDSLSRDQQDALFHGRGGAYKAEMLRSGAIQLSDLVQIAADRAEWTDYVVTETPLEGLVAAND